MAKREPDARQLAAIGARLGDAVIDPAIWRKILDQISASVGAVGAGLLQGDVRSADVPRSSGAEALFEAYFTDAWHTRDELAERAVPRAMKGQALVASQQLFTPDELHRSPMVNELLKPHGVMWWAGVSFRAGSEIWGVSIHRAIKEGPFSKAHLHALAGFSDRLTETATLSKAVGRAVLTGVNNALDRIKQPALALDRLGFVLDANAEAEQIFDDVICVRDRRLELRDQKAKAAFDTFVDQLRVTSDSAALPTAPIVVQRRGERPLLIRILPVDGAAKSPFLGARALLLLADLRRAWGPRPEVLAQTFGLSPAEARLAAIIAKGISPEQAAERLGISRETARTELKAIFAKTATHRQAELVALLSRM